MQNISRTLVKSLLVGAAYTTALALTNFLLRGVEAQSFIWSFPAGVVIGLTLGSLASSIPATRTRHMLIWGSVIYSTSPR